MCCDRDTELLPCAVCCEFGEWCKVVLLIVLVFVDECAGSKALDFRATFSSKWNEGNRKQGQTQLRVNKRDHEHNTRSNHTFTGRARSNNHTASRVSLGEPCSNALFFSGGGFELVQQLPSFTVQERELVVQRVLVGLLIAVRVSAVLRVVSLRRF